MPPTTATSPASSPSAKSQVPSASASSSTRYIRVRGAREHNLKNIDVAIPRDQLVVITGLSGSGKSSLAFDTIFAEGQRKYMESLSAYARQFLDQLKKPDVDEVEGIPPTIAIEQRSTSGNPRSTVATTTEIWDYLRLLYARCGTPYSWAPKKIKKDGTILSRSGNPITATSSTQIVDRVMKWSAGSRLMVMAPVIRGQKGFHRDVMEDLSKQGWSRVRVNGTIHDLRDVLKDPSENPLKLGRHEKHSIDAVLDRLVIAPEIRQRLAESIESALKLGNGTITIAEQVAFADPDKQESWKDHAFSNRFADPENPEYALEEVAPRLFSFNSPFGACKKCDGLGNLLEFDEALVIPHHDKRMDEGAVAAWNKNGPVRAWFNRTLRKFCKGFGASFTEPIKKLSPEQLRILLHGTTPADVAKYKMKFQGVIPNIAEWWKTTENPSVKEFLGSFHSQKRCVECNGDRLRIEALHIQLSSAHKADVSRAHSGSVIGRPRDDGTMLNIAEIGRLTITDALAYIENLILSKEHTQIAEPILKEITNRLRFLTGVGLEYLSLDRKTATLSGGEAQRIRLASQVGSGLVGACYVLDEPTIGLHQRDNTRLIQTLRHLTDIGNTVLVVEHDEDMIRAADHVVDVGPGPGVHGGRIVAQGTVPELCQVPESLTGQYLSGARQINIPVRRRQLKTSRAITIKNARENNLKGIDVSIPVGGLVCITGVSGSGKSTLINDILLRVARNDLLGTRDKPGAHDKITGLKHIDRIIEVDQSPIGRTPRSNPATYVEIFGDIRNIYTQTKESKIRGYEPGRFSFNVSSKNGGGRCEACEGQGLKKIEMHFLPDVYVTCEVCDGKRYNRETLEIQFRGKSIADVLDMTIETACTFFENHPKIHRIVKCLHDVGLDYIKLGQPSTQLSGGEAQRVKLATELGKSGGPSPMPRRRPSDAEVIEEPRVVLDDEAEEKKPAEKFKSIRAGTSSSTLYILDEPTTGLHFEDINRLCTVLDRLADGGNTLVVIEHNLDVIKRADWIIDLGPEGGDKGGTVIAQGPPEEIVKVKASHTGKYLKHMLA